VGVTSLYDLPPDRVDFAAIEAFLSGAFASDLATESRTLELKQRPSGSNVIEAVAAMANSDGGMVLVGVADNGPIEDRLVGISQKQFDGLVNQIRTLLPSPLPEVIPRAIPDSANLIVVIRVDSEAWSHPVVVGGRVLVRVPGASVPADRSMIVTLASRDGTEAVGRTVPAAAMLPHDPMRYPFWQEGDEPHLTLRLRSGLGLPRRAAERPWLPTVAKEALLRSLRAGPLPDGLWASALPDPETELGAPWRIDQARSTSFRAIAPGDLSAGRPGRPRCEGAGYLAHGGQFLYLLLGVGVWTKNASSPLTLSLADLHEGLLGLVQTALSSMQSVAAALNAGHPTKILACEAWLQPRDGQRLDDVLNASDFSADGIKDSSVGYCGPALPQSRELADVDRMVRDWITVLLLDQGASRFETTLDALPLPRWATGSRAEAPGA
jgi:hypothetical protein